MKPICTVPCLRFNPFRKTDWRTNRGQTERQRERELWITQNNRLTKHHINLQVHLIAGKLNAAVSAGWIDILSWLDLQPLILQIFLRSWSAVLNIWLTQRALLKHNLFNASGCVHTQSCLVVRWPFSNRICLAPMHIDSRVACQNI